MLINLSNHPSDKWNAAQTEAALNGYAEIRDLPFPQINPEADTDTIRALAKEYLHKAETLFTESKTGANAVHIMGELTFVYAFVSLATAKQIACVASTTVRNVLEESGGQKTVQFNFVRFRNY